MLTLGGPLSQPVCVSKQFTESVSVGLSCSLKTGVVTKSVFHTYKQQAVCPVQEPLGNVSTGEDRVWTGEL